MKTAKKIFLFLVVGALFWQWADNARPLFAQTGIKVNEDQLIQEFPEQVAFSIRAASDNPIDSVTLRYGTNGRNCQSNGARQAVDIEPGTEIEASWEWDWTRYGILPPGTEIWWEWEIVDETGQQLNTDRKTTTVIDNRFTFQSLQENNITLQWIEGNTAFGEAMLAETIASLARLETEMGIQLNEDITITIYPTAEDVKDAVIHVPEWTGGVAFSRYNSIIVGILPGQNEWAAGVIPHELTHLVEGAITFNCIGVSVPTWLSEGLAEFGETGGVTAVDPALLSALNANDLPSLRSLANGFSAYGNDATLAYVQSKTIVNFLISAYGPDKIAELLIAVRDGEKIDEALQLVYGVDTEGLDALWRDSLGFTPLPTLEPTPDPAQATTVPTMAPMVLQLPPTATATATVQPTIAPTPTTPLTVAPSRTPQPTAIANVESDTETAEAPASPTPALETTESVPEPPDQNEDSAVGTGILFGGGLVLILGFCFYLYLRYRR